MNKILLSLFFSLSFVTGRAQTETFHDFIVTGIAGDTINLADYAGKKVLVVNTASYCAYTPQFAGLVMLDSLYGGPGFAIVGFPCNDFGGQDPYGDSLINIFCTGNYNVAFQMMSKISIIAPDTAEVYKWLQLQSRNGVQDAPVTWNFHKFCIDEAGHWVNHFPSAVNPMDTAITNWINSPSVLGVAENNGAGKVTLIANPSIENIRLSLEVPSPQHVEVELYDVRGAFSATVFQGNLTGSSNISYPVTGLENGLYFIRTKSSSLNSVLKVLVQQ
jgi:glutathione peroxidase